MFDTTAAIQEVLLMVSYVGGIIAGIITAILGLLAALIGLGWGLRKFFTWVTGGTGGFVSSHLRELEADHDLRNRTWKVGGGNEM